MSTIILDGVITGNIDTLQEITGDVAPTILVQGELSTEVLPSTYEGSYIVVPKVYDQTLETALKTMLDDVLIREIPYEQVANPYGDTVRIAD